MFFQSQMKNIENTLFFLDTVPINFPGFVNPPTPYFPMAIQAFTTGILKNNVYCRKWNICGFKQCFSVKCNTGKFLELIQNYSLAALVLLVIIPDSNFIKN